MSDSESDSEGTPKPRRKRGRPAKKSASQEDLFASIMASQAAAGFEVEAPEPVVNMVAEPAPAATEPFPEMDGPSPAPPPAAAALEARAEPAPEEMEAPVPEASNPEKMKVAELRAALKSRGLETKGKKAELVARLSKALSDDVEASPVEEPVPESSSLMTDEMVDMLPNGSPSWLMESVSQEPEPESETDKLLMSLPEMASVAPSPAPGAEMVEEIYDADTDVEDKPVKAVPFEFDGVTYLKDADNDLYDPETMDHIAWWDGTSVQYLDEDSDDEE